MATGESRTRTLTAKGEDYYWELFDSQLKRLEKDLSKRLTLVDNLLKSTSTESSLVKKELTAIDDIQQQIWLIYSKAKNLFSKKTLEVLDDRIGKTEHEVFFVKSLAVNWLKNAQPVEESLKSRSSKKSSSSSHSRRSKTSSSSSVSRNSRKVVDEEVELAALKVRRKFAENEGFTKNLNKIDEEIAVREAKISVYKSYIQSPDQLEKDLPLDSRSIPQLGKVKSELFSEIEDASSHCHKSSAHTKHLEVEKTSIPDRRTSRVLQYVNTSPFHHYPDIHLPHNTYVDNNHDSKDTVQKICEVLKLQNAPKIDLETYSGDPLDFKFFMTNFEEVVEKTVADSMGRLSRLIKFTTGEARELIKGCIYQKDERGYERAKQLLTDRYGDPHKVLSTYSRELRSWKVMKVGDSTSLRQFHTFLLKISGIVRGQLWNTLDSPENLCNIVTKLPGSCRDRWNRKVLSFRKIKLREPGLDDLIQFVDEEVTLACDPLFSREALEERSNTSKLPVKPLKTLLTKLKCQLCSGQHDIEFCPLYKGSHIKDKIRLILNARLCFGCYNKGHMVTDCKVKRTCDICKKRHPTGLHAYDKGIRDTRDNITKVITSDKGVIKSVNVICDEGSISMCIVPVMLRHPKAKSDVMTYALLDPCSQGTFISDELLNIFSISGEKTNITVKTLNGSTCEHSTIIQGLSVRGLQTKAEGSDSFNWYELPVAYSRNDLPVDKEEIPTPDKLKSWPHLQEVVKEIPTIPSFKVGLLVGSNCPRLIEPIQLIPSCDNGPYAFKTRLGWCIAGPFTKTTSTSFSCNKISIRRSNACFVLKDQVEDTGLKDSLERLYELDKVPSTFEVDGEVASQNDFKFLKMMEEGVRKVGDHFELPLPFPPSATLPNNYNIALKRLMSLKKRFIHDHSFYVEYQNFIIEMVDKGYASKVSKTFPVGKTWFIPHHGVYHPSKKKLRVVFDCSSTFQGNSLNKLLLQGPDLTNQLIGVILRFRQNHVAFMADIASMFYQVFVTENQRSFIQFLWWEDDDIRNNVVAYQMNVHLFGATSSPSCANFALRSAAAQGKVAFGKEAADCVQRNFYVDDCLKSSPTVENAVNVLKSTIDLCASGGFHLTKVVSNVTEIMQTISDDNKRTVDDKNPFEKALGITWYLKSDEFHFDLTLKDFPLTKRGVLSALSSLYDPLGLVSPFYLEGKLIFQSLHTLNLSWDDNIPPAICLRWNVWKSALNDIKIELPRCFNPPRFIPKSVSLHHFSDASNTGYGQCSYLRFVSNKGTRHCCLVFAKSRVVPAKSKMSLPRLELLAATLSATVARFLRNEIDLRIDDEYFWCDSKVVLGYIKNHTKRFKLFVSNRVSLINRFSDPKCWFYVSSDQNPADIASRGLKPTSTSKLMWYQGPQFLWEDYQANLVDSEYKVDENSAELKKDFSVNVASIETDNYLLTCIEKFSSFEKMKRILSYILLFINSLKGGQMTNRSRLRNKDKELSLLDVEKLNKAFHIIIKMLQNKHYHEEVCTLTRKGQIKNNSKIQELDPFLDQDNLLRVGGRLKRSSLEFNVKHPLLLPKDSVTSTAIVRHFHTKVYHAGRGITINEIRSNGIWIVNLGSLVRSVIWNCIECRKLRGKIVVQKMGDLPTDRITECAPFSYCGIDLFGPFKIKEKRSILKRYGVIFTCLSSRAVHIESVNSLETDGFIMSLRRMISRRGSVRVIRCDNATNFVGADKELAAQFKKLDHDKIRSFLLALNADWCISFKRNPPYASHFGGVFERQIRSARAVLNGILLKQGEILNDESLRTVLCEVECVLNSRPLTVETLEDPMSLQPLTPNTLLTHKTKIVIPPLSDTSFATSRKYWKRSQHLINEFWNRWKREYLQSLQERSKWRGKRRNVRNGDIVMINTSSNRNEWPIGVVDDVKTSDDGLVRSVSIRKSDGTVLMRPVSKLVVIVENNKGDKDDDEVSSNEEPQSDEKDDENTSSNEEPQIDKRR